MDRDFNTYLFAIRFTLYTVLQFHQRDQLIFIKTHNPPGDREPHLIDDDIPPPQKTYDRFVEIQDLKFAFIAGQYHAVRDPVKNNIGLIKDHDVEHPLLLGAHA